MNAGCVRRMNRAASLASRFTRRVARKPGKPVTKIVSSKSMMKQYPIYFHFSMGTQVILITAITYLNHPSCGFRVDWFCVRVYSWFALQMDRRGTNHEIQESCVTTLQRPDCE